MRVQRAYKTELDLNDWQITACRQHAGAARWAYNWGLQIKHERYEATKKSPTAIELHRELNALKKTEVPWMYDVSKCGLVLDRDLNAAINLEKLAGSLSDSLNACGADSAGTSREAGVKLSAQRGPRAHKKQEQNAT